MWTLKWGLELWIWLILNLLSFLELSTCYVLERKSFFFSEKNVAYVFQFLIFHETGHASLLPLSVFELFMTCHSIDIFLGWIRNAISVLGYFALDEGWFEKLSCSIGPYHICSISLPVFPLVFLFGSFVSSMNHRHFMFFICILSLVFQMINLISEWDMNPACTCPVKM